ncbi:MAG: polysaccharide deacetylase family protein [Prolixibacteraceae bacterium]|nr:polysaccharide deacetylase family protein [Prolixibacteraceae bacterium]
MILFYSEDINPRIDYIARLIFTQILGIEVTFTSNSSRFQKYDQPKINYSYEKFGDEFYIKPHRLLYCKALINPDFKSVWVDGEKYFFESSEDSDLPFDLFAASFYLVTRHEEYLERERGKYKRYPAEKSVLSKYGLLKKPVVNIWARLLAQKLQKKFPELFFPEPRFRFYSTIDIDNAWAYLHKGFWRSAGAIAKSAVKGEAAEARKRFGVLAGSQPDPYDTYEYLDNVFKGNEDKVLFFFLLGDYARYDKNVPFKNKHFRNLIKQISNKYTVGIHPSFSSSKKKGKKKLAKEIQRLEQITGKKAEKSRQHFLRLKMPVTYKRLLKNGISEDYTMGYSSHSGFRAGICTPYYFYDLKKERETKLRIMPFQVMDVTLRNYMQLSPEEAKKEIMDLMQEVKNVGGTFISIWHNETLNDLESWKGYREVFEEMNKTGFTWANEKPAS